MSALLQPIFVMKKENALTTLDHFLAYAKLGTLMMAKLVKVC